MAKMAIVVLNQYMKKNFTPKEDMKGRIKEGGKMWQLESKQQDGRLKTFYINNYIGCK